MTVSANVVCDSVSPEGHRLVSVGVTAHRFILAEINTHRMLSRSYRSSRAVPSKRLIEEVRTNPAMPVHWGANRPGMQAREELTGHKLSLVEAEWRNAASFAALQAEAMAGGGLHKQIANRVLEPFLWAHGIITATEWANFFGLRLHEDAQPEFRALADAIWAAMKASTPVFLTPGEWHLPYVDEEDWKRIWPNEPDGMNPHGPELDLAIKVSVARCARSSYKSFETGNRSTIEEDLEFVRKLNIPGTESHDPTRPIHASPAEHQGTPDILELAGGCGDQSWPAEWVKPEEHGNFVGWRQYRKMLPGEACAPLPKEYRS